MTPGAITLVGVWAQHRPSRSPLRCVDRLYLVMASDPSWDERSELDRRHFCTGAAGLLVTVCNVNHALIVGFPLLWLLTALGS